MRAVWEGTEQWWAVRRRTVRHWGALKNRDRHEPRSPKGELTRAWTSAEAALPDQTWTVMGVVLGLRQADPAIRSASWVAWARGPNHEREGSGDYPEQALRDLSQKLRSIRGDPNG